jgi:regulatory protein
MKVTEIRPRRKGLSALFIDGEFAMALDTQTLLEQRIDVGKELDDEQLHELIALSNERRAKEKALWLISYRSHSKKELRDKIRRTCDADAADKAVERMEELGLVNDEDFARRYAEQLLYGKRLSKRAAFYELRRKGIDQATAEEALAELDVDVHEQIRALIEKKYRNINDEKIRRRAVAALQRLGYGWEDIKAVLEEYADGK